MANKLKMASVLAFERKLDCSDALMEQLKWDDPLDRAPVLVREKSVRGTISNRLKAGVANDPAKLDAKVEKPNLQRVDSASLDADHDTLAVTWTCKVLPFTGLASACNDVVIQDLIIQHVAEYVAEHQFTELSQRYAANIANARWLWRNRIGAERVRVTVRNGQDVVVFENARDLSLNSFENQSAEHSKLASWIQSGLMGREFILLHIEGEAFVGKGQEVYPSQELVLDKSGKLGGDGKKSKVLYALGADKTQAAMHSQKIGNAIRTIDTWYPDATFPIAVEPYGAVTSLGTAFRQGANSFYRIFDQWILDGKEFSQEDLHYIVAVLLRGGIFGESSKE